jgi:hypothetical protein
MPPPSVFTRLPSLATNLDGRSRLDRLTAALHRFVFHLSGSHLAVVT